MTGIHLLPLFCSDPALFSFLNERVTDILKLPLEWYPQRWNLDFSFDVRRNQFHSTKIIEALARFYQTGLADLADGPALPAPPAATSRGARFKALALVDEDLFIPILTFVFGEAQIGGTFGVVSCTRLRNPFYGLPHDQPLFFNRVLKEIIHETGHLFGLHHCPDAGCVMFSSHQLPDTDRKEVHYCTGCLGRYLTALQQFTGMPDRSIPQ